MHTNRDRDREKMRPCARMNARRLTLPWACACLALVSMLPVAAAEPTVATSIAFAAPDECPGAEAFAAQLRFRTGKVAITDEATASAHIAVVVQNRGGRYVGLLELRAGS